MQRTTTYDDLIIDPKAKADFFDFYDGLIADCKRYGFIQSALTHAKNRKRIWDELSLLD